jgi:hypothetical protein
MSIAYLLLAGTSANLEKSKSNFPLFQRFLGNHGITLSLGTLFTDTFDTPEFTESDLHTPNRLLQSLISFSFRSNANKLNPYLASSTSLDEISFAAKTAVKDLQYTIPDSKIDISLYTSLFTKKQSVIFPKERADDKRYISWDSVIKSGHRYAMVRFPIEHGTIGNSNYS